VSDSAVLCLIGSLLLSQGLAHLGNPQVPEPVIHPELLNRVWQPAQRPPTLQPISVLERSVFQHPPQVRRLGCSQQGR